ncbi:hypothetical protein [Kribbella sp. DT2]
MTEQHDDEHLYDEELAEADLDELEALGAAEDAELILGKIDA